MVNIFTREAVLKRPDGTTEYYKGGKLVKEVNPQGNTVIRVQVDRTPSGGVGSVRRVSTTSELATSKQLQKIQEDVNKAAKSVGETPKRVIGSVVNGRLLNVGIFDKGKTTPLNQYANYLSTKKPIQKQIFSISEIQKQRGISESQPYFKEQGNAVRDLVTKQTISKNEAARRRLIYDSIKYGTKLSTQLRGNYTAEQISKLEEKKRKLLGIVQKQPGSFKSIIAGTVGLGAVGALTGAKNLVDAIRNPAKFVRENYNFMKSLVTNPRKTISEVYQTFEQNPAGTIAEYYTFGKLLQKIPTISKKFSQLSPKYIKEINAGFEIYKKPFTSSTNFLKGKIPHKIKTAFKIYEKYPDIILKRQTVQSGATTLAQQALLAGKNVKVAVNAAAEQLTSFISRKKIIRKPIPREANFPRNIKALLKKFDTGNKLTIKEFAKVNSYLRKNVAPNITLLERSLYADPASGLRVSRLGIQGVRDATFRDILRGNFTLRSAKPQVLIFENAKVAKFPKYLRDIELKLKKGKKLTTKETNRLIQWQVKTGSGKFKPIGSTIYKGGKELEITIAPGEYIKRIKRVGFTYIQGKKVNFVTAEIYKPTKSMISRLQKAKSGKLKPKELTKLEKDLSKDLGRKIKVETPTSKIRRGTTQKPLLRIDRVGLKILRVLPLRKVSRTTTTRKTVKRVIKQTPKRTTTTRKTVKRVVKRIPKRTTRKTTRKTTRRTTPRSTKTTRRITPTTRQKPKVGKTTKPRFKQIKKKRIELKPNEKIAYDISFIQNKRQRTLKVALPKNRAIKKLINVLSKTKAITGTIAATGTTKKKDITKVGLKDYKLLKLRNEAYKIKKR